MVPGRKFSSTTSAFAMRRRRMAWPSGAFIFSVRLFLLRFTDMKYVASPPVKGGQPRVSSPLPGSSTLMTSAPMSPSDMEQNGPASTRVRSMTRTPASGGRGVFLTEAFLTGAFCLPVATEASSPHALGQALGDGCDLLAPGAGAPPEEAGPVREAHVGEVKHIVERFDAHARADPDPSRLRAVTEQPRAPFELDQRDVERRLEAFGRRVQRGERDDLTHARHARLLHGHGVIGAVPRRRHDDALAPRAARSLAGRHHRARGSTRVTRLLVARPPMDWASPTRAATCRPSAIPRSCQHSSTICEIPVAASGWPRALSPPEGFTGNRPSRAVSPSRVARPALPAGSSPVSSSEISSNGEKASWISATSTRSGPKPAMAYAACAAACVARNVVRSVR